MSFIEMTYPSMTSPMLPLPYNSNIMVPSRSFTPPDYIDSPTYRPSHVLEKPEVLSPLPDSFYDAYPSNNSNFAAGAVPLLTPPASEIYPPMDLINWHSSEQRKYYDMLYYPPPPVACYSPGCTCQHTPTDSMQSFGLMSPSMFFDPTPYSLHQRKRHYGKHNNSRSSLDSSSSSSSTSSSTIDSPNQHQLQQDSQKSALTPRRYKCTLCIKRFTRPSSLATHMHSHTGEVM
jgi:hypothetical protein